MKTKVLFGSLILALAGNVYADEKVSVTTQTLSPNVHVVFGEGGNVAIIEGEKSIYLVDSQYEKMHDAIQAEVKKVAPNKTVDYVLNTHWHGDHTNGNAKFKQNGATIIAHQNVPEMMSKPRINIMGKESPAMDKQMLPQITFAQKLSIADSNEPIELEYVPNAHTNTDVFIYLPKSNVIHTGDILFNQRFPYIDVHSGGSINGLISGAERIIALSNAETKIIAGHGEVTNREGMKNYLSMLTKVRDNVKSLKDAGKSLNEVLKTEPAKAWEATQNWQLINAEKFVTAIYNSL